MPQAGVGPGAQVAPMPAPASGTATARRAPAPRSGTAPVSQASSRETIGLETGSGRVLTLPEPAANVFVADPRVAEVRPASPTTLFVFGVGPGRTTVAALDTEGHAVTQFEVTVRPSTFASAEVEGTLARLLPNSRIRVISQPNGMILTGSVGSPVEAARAVSIVKGFVPAGQPVDNQMVVQGSMQINLRVRVVEIQRNVTRALGIDWQALGSVGKFAVNFMTANGLGVGSAAAGMLKAGVPDFNATIDALAQDNLVRILAEPNLTVLSGQPGSFLAGGEFPIPVAGQASTGSVPTITVAFKKYGVSLDVVPTVLSDGRINLHVAPEVSQITTTGGVTFSSGSGGPGFQIPGLLVRRAETSIELGSGQSFAIAGLLQDQAAQAASGVTFLGDLPILGPLFRSNAFIRNETELVIIVTPYIVRPVDDPASLVTANNYQAPNDLERILLLRGVSETHNIPATRVPGSAGFVVQ